MIAFGKSLKSSLGVLFCLSIAVITLYALIEQQNQVTELQLRLPSLEKKVSALREKNNELRYKIALFESPENQLSLLGVDNKNFIFPDESEIVEVVCPPE